MSNIINVRIIRKKSSSVQKTISEPTITGNEVSVVCYDKSSDEDVLNTVMYAIDDSELIEGIYDKDYKDAIVNGRTWSLSNCEFRQ